MQLPPLCGVDTALAAPPVPSSPATSTAGIAATASIRCPVASPTRRPLPSDADASSPTGAIPSDSASVPEIRSRPANGPPPPPSRSSGASSLALPAGAAATDSGSAGTQANASAPPMMASSMPRRNPPRLDAGNETMPSTIPAIP